MTASRPRSGVPVLLVLLGGACVALPGCQGYDANVEKAIIGMRSQVASDIELSVDSAAARAHYQHDERVSYAVCGTAELHRPSDMPEMNLVHSRQRFVALIHRGSGAVVTEFEGEPPRPAFAPLWEKRCR